MNKKKNIIEAATRIFAIQGFDGSTTLQIAKEAQVTEPLIYYHFKGKQEIFNHIKKMASDDFISRFNSLEKKTSTGFERIDIFITFYFDFLLERPFNAFLCLGQHPFKFKNGNKEFLQKAEEIDTKIFKYLMTTIKKGIKTGEFNKVPITNTAYLISVMLKSFLLENYKNMKHIKKLKKATIAFIERSLTKSKTENRVTM